MKAAFITGAAGQDGSYLSELLLSKGYSVYGLCRYCSEKKRSRLTHLLAIDDFHLLEGDLTDTDHHGGADPAGSAAENFTQQQRASL